MSNPRLYESDTYVVLETDLPEVFLSASEMLEKLQKILSERQDDLPRDVQKFTSIEDQAQYLLETSCELDMGPGEFLQWYVVRLEK